MTAIQLVVLMTALNSRDLTSGGIVVRVAAMLAITAWFCFLIKDRNFAAVGMGLAVALPIVSLLTAFTYGVHGPPPLEELRDALTEHCGEHRGRPRFGLLEFEDEIVAVSGVALPVVGDPYGAVVHTGVEFNRMRQVAIGGDHLQVERIACTEHSTVCSDHSVSIYEVDGSDVVERAQLRMDMDVCPDDWAFSLGEATSVEVGRIASQIYGL